MAEVQGEVPAVLDLCAALLQPVDGVQRQGHALVQARQDELQNLLDQISKDIDAQQKHLEDAQRLASVFHQKCEV